MSSEKREKMSEEETCWNAKDSDLDDLQADNAPSFSKRNIGEIPKHFINLDHNKNNAPDAVPLTPEPSSNLDHAKTDVEPPSRKPDPVPLTPEPSSNLDHAKTDVEPPSRKPDSVPLTLEPSSNLDHAKTDVEPPSRKPDPVPLTLEPSSNLDHAKTDVKPPSRKPDSVPLTPEPYSSLKIDAVPPSPNLKPDPVPWTPKPSSNLDHPKTAVVPPYLKPYPVPSTPKHKPNLETDALPYIPHPNPKEATGNQGQTLDQSLHQSFGNLSLHKQKPRPHMSIGAISCENLQVGDGNQMHISLPPKGRTAPQKKMDKKLLESYLQSTKKLEKPFFLKFAKNLVMDWKFVGRHLGIEDHDLYIIRQNNKDDLEEACYKMLIRWFEKDPSQCTVGNLAKALNEVERYDLILLL